MKILSGHVLLRITAEEKEGVYEKKIGDLSLITDIRPEEDGMAVVFEQTVKSAEVIAVADDVKHIKIGDIAILDYIVDTLVEHVVCEDDRGKVMCIDSRTVFHTEDKMVYASLRTRTDQFVYRKGDVDEASLIYGVFRDDKLIPNAPYIFCEHRDFAISKKTESGLEYVPLEYGTKIRRILVINDETPEEVQPGSMVVVEEFCLYEREMDGKKFDVIMNQDIEMSFES